MAVKLAEISIVIHVFIGICQISRVAFDAFSHRLLCVFGNHIRLSADRIDFFIIRPTLGAGISRAHQETLFVIRFLGNDREQEINLVRTLDLIESCNEPGIENFCVEFLIFLRERLDLRCVGIAQLQIRLMYLHEPAFLFCLGRCPIISIVFNIQLVSVFVPILEKPLVRRILFDRQINFFRNGSSAACGLIFDIFIKIRML